jgi:hypothetical protein
VLSSFASTILALKFSLTNTELEGSEMEFTVPIVCDSIRVGIRISTNQDLTKIGSNMNIIRPLTLFLLQS